MNIELPKIVNDANVGEYDHEVPVWLASSGALVLAKSVFSDAAENVYLYPEQVQALVNELAKLGIVAEVQA